MLNNPLGTSGTIPEPPTTKAALFFGAIIKPRMMLSISSFGGLPEEGMHMDGSGIDVVATYEPVSSHMAGLKQFSRERGTHLLVARMRPGFAEDTGFELIYNQRGSTLVTYIGDLALYTNGGTGWFLCPTRGDVLFFNVGEMGIEPQVSMPWSTRHTRITGFRQAGELLAGAVGE